MLNLLQQDFKVLEVRRLLVSWWVAVDNLFCELHVDTMTHDRS